MNASVYIADIDIKLIPLNSKSRLHPIHKVLTRYPVVLIDDKDVYHEMFVKSVNRMFKDREMSRYRLVYKVSNLNFSSKCQWSN
jgi:hypothetical protein